MERNCEMICIGSDSETDDTSYIRVTRSKNRRNPKKKMRSENLIAIDLTEPEIKPTKKKTLILEGDLDITIDDDSEEELEENIRAIWTHNASEVKRFFLKPSESLRSVFEYYSQNYNIPIENIRIRIKDKIISLYDNVKSLNLRVTDVLEAYAVQENLNNCSESGENKIEVKCLFQTSKKPSVFYLYPAQNLSCLLDLCAKEINCRVEQIELRFDGEKVSSKDTPSSLELEGGECLDVFVI